MPTPAMMTGVIIGEMSSAVTILRPGIAGWARPSAAAAPSTVATTVAETPMIRLFRIGRVHSSPSKTSRYQRSEYASRVEPQHALREGEVRLRVEAERHEHQDRRDQEDERGDAERQIAPAGDAVAGAERRVGHQPRPIRSMPTRRSYTT